MGGSANPGGLLVLLFFFSEKILVGVLLLLSPTSLAMFATFPMKRFSFAWLQMRKKEQQEGFELYRRSRSTGFTDLILASQAKRRKE